MTDVKPTRSELMKVKNKIKLAKGGYNLLKKKRDGLILDFFDILKEAKSLKQELTEEYIEAFDKMKIARTLESDMKIKSMAMAIREKPEVIVTKKNIMGVVVPKITSNEVKKDIKSRGFGILDSSSSIDESTAAYEKVLEKVIKAAEVETAMKKLLQEIEKTKRRVNALEFSVMPKLKGQENFIKLRLEEMERENIFRLKKIKT